MFHIFPVPKFSGTQIFQYRKIFCNHKSFRSQNFSGPQILLLELVPVGVTLFSNVTTRTPSNFTLKKGSIGLYLKEGERVGVLIPSQVGILAVRFHRTRKQKSVEWPLSTSLPWPSKSKEALSGCCQNPIIRTVLVLLQRTPCQVFCLSYF